MSAETTTGVAAPPSTAADGTLQAPGAPFIAGSEVQGATAAEGGAVPKGEESKQDGESAVGTELQLGKRSRDDEGSEDVLPKGFRPKIVKPRNPARRESPYAPLTDAELEQYRSLRLEGLRQPEIADRMGTTKQRLNRVVGNLVKQGVNVGPTRQKALHAIKNRRKRAAKLAAKVATSPPTHATSESATSSAPATHPTPVAEPAAPPTNAVDRRPSPSPPVPACDGQSPAPANPSVQQ
ncbi:hypothetical protein JCM6882_007390 [Rhodosporidiobolus microsporus]